MDRKMNPHRLMLLEDGFGVDAFEVPKCWHTKWSAPPDPRPVAAAPRLSGLGNSVGFVEHRSA